MKLLPILALAALLTCSTDATAKKKSNYDGDLLWAPPVHEGHRIASIVKLYKGGIQVYVNEAHKWQDATESGRAIVEGFVVHTRWIEISGGSLPEAARAKGHGWRDPTARHIYTTPEFPRVSGGAAYRVPDERNGVPSEIRVFSRGGDYLVVITRFEFVSAVTVGQEAAGAGGGP